MKLLVVTQHSGLKRSPGKNNTKNDNKYNKTNMR